jgi:hypothetical protein
MVMAADAELIENPIEQTANAAAVIRIVASIHSQPICKCEPARPLPSRAQRSLGKARLRRSKALDRNAFAVCAGFRYPSSALRLLADGSPSAPETTCKENPMRLAAYLLAVILIIVAAIYLLLPADSLPAFFPGHEAGLTRIRLKHGIAAGAAGVILLLIGWFVGRSKA